MDDSTMLFTCDMRASGHLMALVISSKFISHISCCLLQLIRCAFVCRYESSVDAEVQQRAVEFLALSQKGPSMVDIMAEMPKFPERQV
jgi:hypothetical protein